MMRREREREKNVLEDIIWNMLLQFTLNERCR